MDKLIDEKPGNLNFVYDDADELYGLGGRQRSGKWRRRETRPERPRFRGPAYAEQTGHIVGQREQRALEPADGALTRGRRAMLRAVLPAAPSQRDALELRVRLA